MASHRKLGFESLESRKVCAGNLNVSVINGTLSIHDDNTTAANYVDIQQQSIGGVTKFVVTGKPFAGNYNPDGSPILSGPATTINGKTTPFRAVASKLDVFTSRGNDAVVVGGTGLQVQVTGLRIVTGLGSDYARLKNVRVASTALTQIEMTQADGVSPDGQKELGNDKVVIDGLLLTSTGGLLIATGGGNDKVVANNFKVNAATQNTYVVMGNGADTLSVTNGIFSNVSVTMGASAEKDTVTVKSLRAKQVTVDLGAGNGDLLNLISNVIVTTKTTLRGGAGTGDQLKLGNPSSIDANGLNITGFEIKPFGL